MAAQSRGPDAMYDQDSPAAADEIQTPNRRQVLLTAGSLGMAALLAGCDGHEGPGVNNTTTAGPTDTPTDTMTETATETMTETETDTETATETGEAASVRVAHLSPDAPNVDVYVDDEAVLEDVPFGAVSDYLSLAAGTYTVKITPAGDAETAVFEGDVSVEAEMAYTVAAIGEVSEGADEAFRPLVLTDENETPASGSAKVRAVHASPDAPAVDITAGDTVLFDGVAFGESGYVEVPAGDYTLEFRGDTETNDGEVAASFDVSLASETVYTAWASGYLTPDDDPGDAPFDLVVTEDASPSA